MNATETTDAWCDLIEAALAEDTPEAWARATSPPGGVLSLPADPGAALGQAERLAELMGRIEANRLLARTELDAVTEERRFLVTHARAVTGYRTTGSPEPIARLLRMMWVG